MKKGEDKMIPKALKKLVKEVVRPIFKQNVDILYFYDELGRITGKIDFTMRTITGKMFKGFKRG
jgi:hypothetical protein